LNSRTMLVTTKLASMNNPLPLPNAPPKSYPPSIELHLREGL